MNIGWKKKEELRPQDFKWLTKALTLAKKFSHDSNKI